jgi:hypothetical protein
MAGVVSIDAASSAADTPVASSSGRGSKQYNPLREAALRPGEHAKSGFRVDQFCTVAAGLQGCTFTALRPVTLAGVGAGVVAGVDAGVFAASDVQ